MRQLIPHAKLSAAPTRLESIPMSVIFRHTAEELMQIVGNINRVIGIKTMEPCPFHAAAKVSNICLTKRYKISSGRNVKYGSSVKSGTIGEKLKIGRRTTSFAFRRAKKRLVCNDSRSSKNSRPIY